MKKNKKNNKKDFFRLLIMISVACIPLFISTGCNLKDGFKCTACGNDENRIFVYASGTTSDGIKYKSCVGPAGIFGLGLGCSCWSTECLSVTIPLSSSKETTGCVKYYNGFGCIDRTKEMSEGSYTTGTSCLGISCGGKDYSESVGDSTRAYEQDSCLGIGCGNEVPVTSQNYNSMMPRQFRKGCWSCD